MSHGIKGGVATVFVSNMDRSVDFYTRTLGLTLKGRWGNEWASIDAGSFSIGLHPASADNPAGKSGSIHIGFNIDEPIEGLVSKLQAQGVLFRGPIVEDAGGAIKLAMFGDPDGHALYLCQQKGGW